MRLVETLSNPSLIHSEVAKLFKARNMSEAANDEAQEDDESASADAEELDLTDEHGTFPEKDSEDSKYPAKNVGSESCGAKESGVRSRVNTLDLTGYKVRAHLKENPYQNFQAGGGKISSALGELGS